jgi:predicted dehydrogenase
MSKVRVGVIGAGWWATFNHMPQLASRGDVELAGVCRLGKDLLEKIQQRFEIPFATEDYRKLLEQDLDAVIVSTPHHLHHEHAGAALRRGLHVMCEKPMTLDPAHAWELVRLAEEKQRTLLVPYGWNYKPFSQDAKRLMEEGAVGEVEYALCHMASPSKEFFGAGGSVEVMSQWEPTLAAPEPSTWQVAENGGGYGHGQVTHSSSLLMWLTGLRAAEVSARMTSPGSPVDMYDAASVRFENGAIGVVSGAATLPANDKFQVDLRIFGTEGVMMIDMERERMVVRRHDGKHHEAAIQPGTGAYDCVAPPHRFIEVIKGEARNDSPGELGARAVELISAMFASSRDGGGPVRVYREA